MKRFILSLLAVLGLGFLTVSCNNDDGESNELAYIWFEISGKVIDQAGAPIQGITVMAESAEPVKTDSKGMFTVNGGGSPADSAPVRFVDADENDRKFVSKTVIVDLEKFKDGHGWNKGYYRNRSEVVVTLTEEAVITPPSSDVETGQGGEQ